MLGAPVVGPLFVWVATMKRGKGVNSKGLLCWCLCGCVGGGGVWWGGGGGGVGGWVGERRWGDEVSEPHPSSTRRIDFFASD